MRWYAERVMSTSSESGKRLKSAYEAALERLESQGITAPDESALSDAAREQVAEARRKAEAKRAELEILHREALAEAATDERERLEERYRGERRRIDAELERQIDRLRRGDSA